MSAYQDVLTRHVLDDIHEQLTIKNKLEVLKEMYEMGIIDRETYAENLRVLYERLK